jgi:hypothetical protein
MPTECSPALFEFPRVEGRAVVASFDGGQITSEAGALLLGATDKVIGLTRRLAACFQDHRDPAFIEHTLETLLMQRVVGIALGYEDLIDHDELRHDPVLAVLAGKLAARRSDCAPLAGKSTLHRLEHGRAEPNRYARISADAGAIEALFVELFLDAHAKAPSQITLDLDATDDPLHGQQEGRFFHGYYDGYCYLPLYIFLAGTFSRPSCAAPTSTPRRARGRRWRASSARSAPAGRACAFCSGAIAASAARP